MAQDNDTFTEMFIGAIFGLIVGQVIAGRLFGNERFCFANFLCDCWSRYSFFQ